MKKDIEGNKKQIGRAKESKTKTTKTKNRNKQTKSGQKNPTKNTTKDQKKQENSRCVRTKIDITEVNDNYNWSKRDSLKSSEVLIFPD